MNLCTYPSVSLPIASLTSCAEVGFVIRSGRFLTLRGLSLVRVFSTGICGPSFCLLLAFFVFFFAPFIGEAPRGPPLFGPGIEGCVNSDANSDIEISERGEIGESCRSATLPPPVLTGLLSRLAEQEGVVVGVSRICSCRKRSKWFDGGATDVRLDVGNMSGITVSSSLNVTPLPVKWISSYKAWVDNCQP